MFVLFQALHRRCRVYNVEISNISGPWINKDYLLFQDNVQPSVSFASIESTSDPEVMVLAKVLEIHMIIRGAIKYFFRKKLDNWPT